MLSVVGERMSVWMRSVVPDPFVLAVLLTGVVFVGAWGGTGAGAGDLLRSWQAGFWSLLAFGMQMCLILVTGHALASSGVVSRGIGWVAGRARTVRGGVVLTAGVAMGAGLLNWGFGLIVGAVLAREVGLALGRRGVVAPRGLLAAAGYTAMLVWHGGLSGSAPLKAASAGGQAEVLGAELAGRVGVIGLDQTVLSGFNVVVTGGVVVIALVVLGLMSPRTEAGAVVVEEGGAVAEPVAEEPGVSRGIAGWLEGSALVVWLIAGPALVWLGMRVSEEGFGAVDLNAVNLLFLSLGLVLHGSARGYGRAVGDGVVGCAGIIVQFPLYAGVMGMMTLAGVGAGEALKEEALAPMVSGWFAGLAGDDGGALRALTFVSAGLVNLFVPSGGGQWAVQGPIAMSAALECGSPVGRTLMAVAYGDQLTNMLQPFWALPLLAITRAKAGEVVGYTVVVMVAAGLWMLGCVWFV